MSPFTPAVFIRRRRPEELTPEARAELLLRRCLTREEYAGWRRGEGVYIRTRHRSGFGLRGEVLWAIGIRVVAVWGYAPRYHPRRPRRVRRGDRLCVYPGAWEGEIPFADRVLGLKLFLEGAPDRLMATANVTSGWRT